MLNVADFLDPSDGDGRTYRQVNHDRNHLFPVGALVELLDGERLYVALQTRDCDGSVMYSLSIKDNHEKWTWSNGHSEFSLTAVNK